MISIKIFKDESISDAIYTRMATLTGPEAETRLFEVMREVRKKVDDEQLYSKLEEAVIGHYLEQTHAAFVTGYEAATKPAPWIFEPEREN